MENLYELVYMIRQEDETATNMYLRFFMEKQYSYAIGVIINNMPYLERYRDDYIQECLIKTMEATYVFRYDRDCSLMSFVLMCVRRHLYNSIRNSLRMETRQYEVCGDDMEDGCEETAWTILGFKADPLYEPEYAFYYGEAGKRANAFLSGLKEIDRKVFISNQNGNSYHGACMKLAMKPKTYERRLYNVRNSIRDVVRYG
ncbi:MAG: hypothetical protein HUJ57_03665 [Erysipelotrichaceae bacterium]|nr:hypothetical protein [Erysipelotrichaceae bacterium]